MNITLSDALFFGCRRSGEIFRSMEIHCVPENVYAALVSSHYFKEKRGMEYGRTDIAHFK